jgi:hypothetical protein
MHTPRPLSPELATFLKECGISKTELARSSMATRTFHDLGWYGDEAEGCLEWLVEKYGVDLTGFDFDIYYPPEFESRSKVSALVLSLLPFVGSWLRRRRSYLPLTLQMIDRLIQDKQWKIVAMEHSKSTESTPPGGNPLEH